MNCDTTKSIIHHRDKPNTKQPTSRDKDDFVIKYNDIIKYFEPFEKANQPTFMKWQGFAIINQIAFTKFLKNYMIDNGMLKPDEVALKEANGLLNEIKHDLDNINNKIKKYFR